MENKTAVQIFFEDLCHLGYIEYPDENLVQDRLNLALELEKQQAIDLVQSLKDYTLESQTVLGNDEREAAEFVEIYYETTYKK